MPGYRENRTLAVRAGKMYQDDPTTYNDRAKPVVMSPWQTYLSC